MNRMYLLGLALSFVCPVLAQGLPDGSATAENPADATNSVVAVDQGVAIRKSDLRQYIRTIQKVLETRVFYGYAGPRKAVRALLVNRRLADQAREEKAFPDGWNNLTVALKRRLLVLMVREQLEAAGEISEETLEAYYRSNPEEFLEPDRITFRHIFLEVPPGASEEVWEKTRLRLVELRQRAKAGEEFAELARRYSEVPSGAKGGLVEKIAARDIRVEEFVQEVFRLEPGRLSEPIRTRYGYHLAVVEAVHPGQVRPFEEVRDLGRLERWMSEQGLGKELQEIASQMSEFWKVETHFELLPEINRAAPDAVLFRVAQATLTVGDLRTLLGSLPDTSDPEHLQWLRDYLQGMIHAELIYGHALLKKLDLTEEFQRRFRCLEEYILAQRYLLRQVEHSPRLDDEGLRGYYEANRGRFHSERSMEASQIFCSAGVRAGMPQGERYRSMRAARQRAEAIRARLTAGEDFATLAAETSDDALAELGGSLGKITYGSMPAAFEAAAYALEAGQISEPVELKDGYVLIRVEKLYPSRQLTFDEARAQIADFLGSEILQRLSDKAWASLLESGQVQVFDEEVRKVWR